MIPESAIRLLESGLEQLKVKLTEDQCDKMLRYIKVLVHWNRTFNLTAIRDFNDMMLYHLLDSIAIQPYVEAHKKGCSNSGIFHGAGGSCVDIGSGAGVPGIPLAIQNPDLRWSLIDSNGKKIRFLRHVTREADLNNVEVIQSRIEVLQLSAENHRPLLVTARALATSSRIVDLVKNFMVPGDRLLLMKGLKGIEEAADTFEGFTPFQLHEIKVPYLDAKRFLLTAERI